MNAKQLSHLTGIVDYPWYDAANRCWVTRSNLQ